jgi:DNA-directed RNA polymerase subunit N (RpoN/RPB10)
MKQKQIYNINFIDLKMISKVGVYKRPEEETVDVVDLQPIRCMTCGKVLREKYFDTYDELVGTIVSQDDLLIRLYKQLALIIKNEYDKTQDLKLVAKNLNLEKFYDKVEAKNRKYVNQFIESIIYLIEERSQELLQKGNDVEQILERLQLDEILGDAYKKLVNSKYRPEDVFDKLNISRPCCRTSIAFTPKMSNPLYGPILGYDIEPDQPEPEPEPEPEPVPKDKASKLRSLLLKTKEKKQEKPTIKKVSKYYAI